MHLHFDEQTINDTPVLLVYGETPEKSAQKGTVLFYHGLLSNKRGSEKELISLAENGYLVVSADNFGHGARKAGDFNTRFHSSNPDFENNFIDAVRRTVNEIPALIDELEKTLLYRGKLGICGISMGGFITYGAVALDKRIKAACPIAGCPDWLGDHKDSPHLKPERFYPAALLSQNGGSDHSVNPRYARQLHQQLLPFYAEEPGRLAYVEFEGEGHFMTEQGWYFLWENVLIWFNHFLADETKLR